jgi:hypothetical protein
VLLLVLVLVLVLVPVPEGCCDCGSVKPVMVGSHPDRGLTD